MNCALWSAEVFEDDDGSLKNVHMAVIRGKQLVGISTEHIVKLHMDLHRTKTANRLKDALCVVFLLSPLLAFFFSPLYIIEWMEDI